MSDSPVARTSLLQLAPELLDLVLSHLAPADLIRFGSTCRSANAFVQPSNQLLWRSSFLHIFDDPKDAWDALQPTARAGNRPREARWDWFHEVHQRYAVFNALCHGRNAALLANPEGLVTTLLDVIDTASYSASPDLRVSLNMDWMDRLFRQAPNPERIVHDFQRDLESIALPFAFLTGSSRPFTRSMLGRRAPIPDWASRFHICYGMTEREDDSNRAKASARALVYDWTVTGPRADYGPFKKDKSGTVNWQLLEAITSLMLRVFGRVRNRRLQLPRHFRDNIANMLCTSPSCKEDWAGINRTWLGTYAFLDYRALVHYNFANNLEYPMDLGAYEEACGDIMQLELNVSDSEELRNDRRLQTELPLCQDLPTLYFDGTSHGRQDSGRPPILVRGCTSLVPGGREVRWRFIISYAGADQWQLEGVQSGGTRSGGIYGLWSHCDHDEHGPIGPFCYFPSEVCERP